MTPPDGSHPLRHIIQAFGYSMAGLRAAWRHEIAFRLEVGACVILAPAVFWLTGDTVERVLLLTSLLLVLVTELVNSAIEAAVDRMGEEYHPLSERAKDIGSAAVFMSLLLTALVWSLLALPPLLALF